MKKFGDPRQIATISVKFCPKFLDLYVSLYGNDLLYVRDLWSK
jgi:hypothetical protein